MTVWYCMIAKVTRIAKIMIMIINSNKVNPRLPTVTPLLNYNTPASYVKH